MPADWPFQSTLPRRERHAARRATVATAHFNPRSREGSDQVGYNVMRCRDISIHAPAKGATPWGLLYFQPRNHFNPRSREGSDSRSSGRTYPVSSFQSTLPRRERPGDDPPAPHRHDFNPRSREGSDGPTAKREVFRIYFNPRSREGSDLQVR